MSVGFAATVAQGRVCCSLRVEIAPIVYRYAFQRKNGPEVVAKARFAKYREVLEIVQFLPCRRSA